MPGGGRGGGALEFPVEVASVESRPVEYSVSAVGSVEAFERVANLATRAGVEGRRLRIHAPLEARPRKSPADVKERLQGLGIFSFLAPTPEALSFAPGASTL